MPRIHPHVPYSNLRARRERARAEFRCLGRRARLETKENMIIRQLPYVGTGGCMWSCMKIMFVLCLTYLCFFFFKWKLGSCPCFQFGLLRLDFSLFFNMKTTLTEQAALLGGRPSSAGVQLNIANKTKGTGPGTLRGESASSRSTASPKMSVFPCVHSYI